jgi:hypothetical protein
VSNALVLLAEVFDAVFRLSARSRQDPHELVSAVCRALQAIGRSVANHLVDFEAVR